MKYVKIVWEKIVNFFTTLFGMSKAEQELRQKFHNVVSERHNQANRMNLVKLAIEDAQDQIEKRTKEIEDSIDRKSMPHEQA